MSLSTKPLILHFLMALKLLVNWSSVFASFICTTKAHTLTFKYFLGIGNKTLLNYGTYFIHIRMCRVVYNKYLCKNQWCGRWAESVMFLESTWVACDLENNPNNYSKNCPNYKPTINERMEHSNHYYCKTCKASGYVDE